MEAGSISEQDPSSSARGFALAAWRETLGRSTDVDACLELAARIAQLMGEALEYFRQQQTDIACGAGCNFCCHLRVMVYPHEAIALFRYLGSRMPQEQAQQVRQRLTANAAGISKHGGEGRADSVACAFLVDGLCSAYEARPAACASYHSLSRLRCEQAHGKASTSPSGIPVSQAVRHIASALNEGLEQALVASGLSTAQVELQTAVAALLRNPALIARWRSGAQWPRDARGVMRAK